MELIGFDNILLIPDTKPGFAPVHIPEDYLVLIRDNADPRDM